MVYKRYKWYIRDINGFNSHEVFFNAYESLYTQNPHLIKKKKNTHTQSSPLNDII